MDIFSEMIAAGQIDPSVIIFGVIVAFTALLFVVGYALRANSQQSAREANMQQRLVQLYENNVKATASLSTAIETLTNESRTQTATMRDTNQRMATALVDLINAHDETKEVILKPVRAISEEITRIHHTVSEFGKATSERMSHIADTLAVIDNNRVQAVEDIQAHVSKQHAETRADIAQAVEDLRNLRDKLQGLHEANEAKFKEIIDSLNAVESRVMATTQSET